MSCALAVLEVVTESLFVAGKSDFTLTENRLRRRANATLQASSSTFRTSWSSSYQQQSRLCRSSHFRRFSDCPILSTRCRFVLSASALIRLLTRGSRFCSLTSSYVETPSLPVSLDAKCSLADGRAAESVARRRSRQPRHDAETASPEERANSQPATPGESGLFSKHYHRRRALRAGGGAW